MGYTFAGWNTAANGSGTAYAAGATTSNITTATTFYAQWTERTGFSAVFYDQASGASDGTAYNTQGSLKWTANVTLPTAPTKTGYTFGGWFFQKDSNGSGTRYADVQCHDLQQPVERRQGRGPGKRVHHHHQALRQVDREGPRHLYPEPQRWLLWQRRTGVTTTANILNGGSYTIPSVTNPTRVGYNFLGWTETKDSTTATRYQAGATFNNLTASKTLYALWQAAQVTFTFQPGAADATIKSGVSPTPTR